MTSSTLKPAPRRPRRKLVFPAAQMNDGTIHIGGIDRRHAALIDDPSGWVWALLGLADGTLDCTELASRMRREWPRTTAEDVSAAVSTLAEAGYFEDAVVRGAPDRYARNRDFLGFYARHPQQTSQLQDRLRSSRVAVVGVGGLGGFVAASMAGLGVGTLRLIDDDVVETSNLNRQFLYTAADVGRPKVDAARARLQQINPEVSVEIQQRRLRDETDTRNVFAEVDLVCCAADRPRVFLHQWMNAAALATGVPWLFGSSAGLTLQAVAFSPGHSACFECMRSTFDDGVMGARAWLGLGDAERGEFEATVSPCIAPTASALGGLAALLGMRLLLDRRDPMCLDVSVFLDVDGFGITRAPFARVAECPACGQEMEGRP